MVDWKVRRFDEKDKKDFLNWRKLVARRKKSKEFLMWEYFNGPWGPTETTIADYQGKIVGQYSTQRYEAFYFGEKIKASLSFDTGTHPDFRRQGIFVTLGNHHFKEEGNQEIHFSTGFPNENFWPGGKKFNWHGLCPIPLLENEAIHELPKELIKDYEFQEITSFDEEFKGFSEKFKDQIPIYLNRTRDYLNWRFCEKPDLEQLKYSYLKYKIFDKSGEFISYIVLKYFQAENQMILHLVDFLIEEDEILYKAVLNFLLENANNNGVKKISLFSNRLLPFSKFLEKVGFKYAETKRVYIVRANNDFLDKEVLFDEKNHFFTMGDSDVI